MRAFCPGVHTAQGRASPSGLCGKRTPPQARQRVPSAGCSGCSPQYWDLMPGPSCHCSSSCCPTAPYLPTATPEPGTHRPASRSVSPCASWVGATGCRPLHSQDLPDQVLIWRGQDRSPRALLGPGSTSSPCAPEAEKYLAGEEGLTRERLSLLWAWCEAYPAPSQPLQGAAHDTRSPSKSGQLRAPSLDGQHTRLQVTVSKGCR